MGSRKSYCLRPIAYCLERSDGLFPFTIPATLGFRYAPWRLVHVPGRRADEHLGICDEGLGNRRILRHFIRVPGRADWSSGVQASGLIPHPFVRTLRLSPELRDP